MLAVFGTGIAPSAQAQNQPPSLLASLLAGVEEILWILDPAPGPITLSTGIVSLPANDLAWCALTNVGDTALGEVTRSLIKADGTTFATGGSQSLAPGLTSAGGAGGPAAFVRCEFEFDGRASDVRAVLFVVSDSNNETTAVLEAH